MTESTIAFGQPLPDLEQLDDTAFLRAVAWRKAADRKLARAVTAGDVPEFTRLLRRQLRGGTRRGRPLASLPLWATTHDSKRSNGRPHGGGSIVELQRALAALHRTADTGADPELFAAWRSTLLPAIELSLANGWPPAEATRADRPPDVADLARHGELPWLAGFAFEDVAGAGKLRKAARQRLHAELFGRTDEDGVPQAALIGMLAEWFASLVRAAEWGEIHERPLWNAATAERFARLTQIVTALCDRQATPDIHRHVSNAPDGCTNGVSRPPVSQALASAVRLAGWKHRKPAARLAQALTNGATRQRPDIRNSHRPLRDHGRLPSTQSDASQVACLRTDWSIDADVLALAYGSPVPELRLSIFGVPLVCGPWEIDIRIDGQPLTLGEWHCVCWSSDDDGDYLELQQRLADNLRIERQILLTREDRLLVLADVVSGAGERAIEYVSRLPLVDGVAPAPERETREVGLRCGKLTARAFPLALPDDRVLSTPGAFEAVGGVLQLRQTARGGLYAPLVIDWHPRRRRGYADWRTLTVAEEGRRLSQAEAWGHRLRVADHQVLIYRSLTETRPLRTILGQHTAYETLMGKFDADGEVEAYVMVE